MAFKFEQVGTSRRFVFYRGTTAASWVWRTPETVPADHSYLPIAGDWDLSADKLIQVFYLRLGQSDGSNLVPMLPNTLRFDWRAAFDPAHPYEPLPERLIFGCQPFAPSPQLVERARTRYLAWLAGRETDLPETDDGIPQTEQRAYKAKFDAEHKKSVELDRQLRVLTRQFEAQATALAALQAERERLESRSLIGRLLNR
jgi:hypothetical protein